MADNEKTAETQQNQPLIDKPDDGEFFTENQPMGASTVQSNQPEGSNPTEGLIDKPDNSPYFSEDEKLDGSSTAEKSLNEAFARQSRSQKDRAATEDEILTIQSVLLVLNDPALLENPIIATGTLDENTLANLSDFTGLEIGLGAAALIGGFYKRFENENDLRGRLESQITDARQTARQPEDIIRRAEEFSSRYPYQKPTMDQQNERQGLDGTDNIRSNANNSFGRPPALDAKHEPLEMGRGEWYKETRIEERTLKNINVNLENVFRSNGSPEDGLFHLINGKLVYLNDVNVENKRNGRITHFTKDFAAFNLGGEVAHNRIKGLSSVEFTGETKSSLGQVLDNVKSQNPDFQDHKGMLITINVDEERRFTHKRGDNFDPHGDHDIQLLVYKNGGRLEAFVVTPEFRRNPQNADIIAAAEQQTPKDLLSGNISFDNMATATNLNMDETRQTLASNGPNDPQGIIVSS